MRNNAHRKAQSVRLVSIIAIVVTLFLAMKFLPVQQWLRSFNDWVVQMGLAGIFRKQGAKLVFLLRLSPVIPFNLSNYFYGLTVVKFWPYVLASWIGMMPGTFLYVYIGTAGKAAVSAAGGEAVKQGWQYWTFMSIGLVATIAVTIWVTKIARDSLKKTAGVKS